MLSPAGHMREYSCVLPIRSDSAPEAGHKRMSECHAWRRGGAACRDQSWSILPSRCDGRLWGQRLCVPGDGRGANVTRNGEAGFNRRLPAKRSAAIATLAAASVLCSQAALADEGGVSLWLPGFFGSLAASPQQPGWSLTSIYYHTTVSAGADVTKAREITIGRIPVNLNANVSANLDARGDLGLVMHTYIFDTPSFGGQMTVGDSRIDAHHG